MQFTNLQARLLKQALYEEAENTDSTEQLGSEEVEQLADSICAGKNLQDYTRQHIQLFQKLLNQMIVNQEELESAKMYRVLNNLVHKLRMY